MDGVADIFFFFSSRRRHTRLQGDWSSDVCSSDLEARSSIRLCSTPAGPGKYGSGSKRNPEVITSHKHDSETAPAIIGHMCRSHRRRCDENDQTAAATIAEPRMMPRKME